MNSHQYQQELVTYWTHKCQDLLQNRNNLSRDDLEYLAVNASKLKDVRLQECIGSLIGWSDDERAELETFIAIALEVMKNSSPARLRDAARLVEIRNLERNDGHADTR